LSFTAWMTMPEYEPDEVPERMRIAEKGFSNEKG